MVFGDSKGFTLIELLIVVAIIGILATIGLPVFIDSKIKSHNSAALSDINAFKTALDSYYVEHQQYP